MTNYKDYIIMRKRITLFLAAFFSLAAFAQTDVKVICGNLVNSNGSVPVGIYAIPLTSDDFQVLPVVINPEIKADNGGTIVNGQFHFVNRNSDRQYLYHKFDMNTWQRIGEPEVIESDFKVGDMAYDESENRLWAYFDEEWPNGIHTYSRFGYADADTKEVTILREGDQIKREMMAVCIGPDNEVYAMDPLSRIWKVDKTTGEPTVFLRLGMKYWIGEGHYSETRYAMTYDDEANCFYITLIPNDDLRSLLVSVDVATGEVKEIGEFQHDEEFGALWITTLSTADIQNVADGNNNSDQTVFDLQGSCISAQNAKSGLYINNGKKVIVK
jgi:hypothetical protein